MSATTSHDTERWWILAGCSSAYEWTPSESRWATIERRAVGRSLPLAVRRKLDGIVVDWDARADAAVVRAMRPGDRLVVIASDHRGRWQVEPAMTLRAKDTYWWPSMRRTSMLTVERPVPPVRAPLARVLDALAKDGMSLRRGGMQSYGVTAPARIAILARTLSPESIRRLAR